MSVLSPRVALLPENLINQIAAGEVVERPASVVKELLDNSLDAGADELLIEIEQGGIGLIRLRDNGIGIRQEDLQLALTRHATSKLRTFADLRGVMTLGFRGEALPSMASISRFSITSCFHVAEHAWCIANAGSSELPEPRPASHPVGTTVEIRDLFYNIPARRKFLRSERTEFYHILQLIRHYAVSHPLVSFRVTHNGRQVFRVNAVESETAILARLSEICGQRFADNAIHFDQTIEGLHLFGWLGNAHATRTLNDAQFFALNARQVKDKRIQHAILQAYQGLLPEGRYASYVVDLEMDPEWVDVNVHPAKTEVRFREGRKIHDVVYSVLHSVLSDQVQSHSAATTTQEYPAATTQSINNPAPFSHSVAEKLPYAYQASIRRGQSDSHRQESPLPSHSPQGINSPCLVGEVLLLLKDEVLLLIEHKAVKTRFIRDHFSVVLKTGEINPLPLMFPVECDSGVFDQNRQVAMQRLGFCMRATMQRLLLTHIPAVLSAISLEQLIKASSTIMKNDQAAFIETLIDSFCRLYVEDKSAVLPQSVLIELQQSGLAELDRFPSKKLDASALSALLRSDTTL